MSASFSLRPIKLPVMANPLYDALGSHLMRRAFNCRRCLNIPSTARKLHAGPSSRPLIQELRSKLSKTTNNRPRRLPSLQTAIKPSFQTRSFGQSLKRSTTLEATAKATPSHEKTSFFPEQSQPIVAYWLIGSAVSVFGIVVFGGLTRLTESGLSITEWKPVTGSLPPMSEEDWESEFALYRDSPEFHLLNRNMTLPEFKEIYWMEWTHRLWGRFIGITFAIPTAYFIARGRCSARTAKKLVGITGLIGFQGFIGWWMVKSGLKDDLFAPGSHPRVSQYRLTAHLATAIITYAAMLTTGLNILRARKMALKGLKHCASYIESISSGSGRRYRRLVTGLNHLIFTTVLSGALVAGLDAGLIYNEFPYMGNGLTPPASELFDRFYVRSDPEKATTFELVWRNMLENPSTVQLDHRILAITTFTAILGFWGWSRFANVKYATIALRQRSTLLLSLAVAQVSLGLSTLLYLVPTPVAAAHQAGALALLTGGLLLRSRLSVPKSVIARVNRMGPNAVPRKLGLNASIPSPRSLPSTKAKPSMEV